MDRRVVLFFIVNGTLFAVACDVIKEGNTITGPQAPPPSNTSPLLSRVQALGYTSAQRVPFGNNAAARIAIDGSINWNFLVRDQPVAIGPNVPPTLDVSMIQIPNDGILTVR